VIARAALAAAVSLALVPGRGAPCSDRRFMATMTRGVLERVDVYPAATADTSTKPVRSLSGEHTTLCRPRDLAVDTRGRLHALSGEVISVFEPGARGDAAPVRLLELPAKAIGLDRRDHLYVATWEDARPSDRGSITVHARGAEGEQEPVRTLAGARTGLERPFGVAVDAGGHIFATNEVGDTVRIFGARAGGDVAPAGYLAGPRTGLRGPKGLALDRGGSLYVANAGGGTVTVYPPRSEGDVAPARTIEPPPADGGRRFRAPDFLALDRHDTLYVAANGAVWVFGPKASGKVPPVRTLLVPEHHGLAVGKDGALYVANRMGRVSVFAPGARDSAAPVRTIEDYPDRSGALGVALGAGDTLYVADVQASGVRTYRPGARGTAVPVRTLSGPGAYLSDPRGIAIDRRGTLYVASGPQPITQGAIRVYAPGSTDAWSPLRIITGRRTRLSRPEDVAVDSRGYIYAANRAGAVTVYAPGAEGDAAPVRVIAGRNTLLRDPAHLAIGPGDTLYVLNAFGGFWKYGNAYVTVTVYSPRSSGDVEPVRTINVTGSPTAFDGRFATGIAVDARGSVYLSDYSSNVVPVYAPGAGGDAAPTRRIRLGPADPTKGPDWPGMGGTAITISPEGELFVAVFPRQMVFTRLDLPTNRQLSRLP
jgi:sugar lactone lactonase YvrE